MIDRATTPDPQLDRFRTDRDEASLRALMDAHAPSMRAVVRRVLRRRDLVEDAVQEAFIKLVRDPDAIHGSAGPWLRTVALHAALDLLRVDASQRRSDRTYSDDAARAHSGPGGIDDDVRQMITDCIARLDDAHRTILARRFFVGLSQEEVAREEGISQVAVHKRERRALEALRWQIVRSGMFDCLQAMTGELAAARHGAIGPVDPACAMLMAIVSLPWLLGRAGLAGGRAGITAAALCTRPLPST